MRNTLIPLLCLVCLLSCMRVPQQQVALVLHESPEKTAAHAKQLQSKTNIKLADGLQLKLWASDSLAPDPVAMAIDDAGRVYLASTNRAKSSEFDIRGHQNWMTESIGFQTTEDRRAFLHKTFAPEKSEQNMWLKDLNQDGSHDWRDLTVEKEVVWRLEDQDHDGLAESSTRVVHDFSEEITDVAGGILVRENDAFLAVAPDLWRLEDKNKDGIYDKKTSISHGYAVHIGFSGHGMSGVVEGPDGKIYWNIGDIGANITAADGTKHPNPNSGIIARANPDGSDFEIFATGLRNTHEFAFDEYGNLISSDNDGDHPGESERLVHVVQDSDAGWRSNWQYGKYTDPKNNKYKVWMDEKLYKPRWDGQAAYIIPPIMNYHNGPTGMIYNPGTALGKKWKNKFFLVEFVGSPSHSNIWAFDLKPKGASFELNTETKVLNGVLPTGIKFGPDGAMYVADWVNGWNAKDYGRVWKLDVNADKNDLEAQRRETKRLIQLNYAKQPVDSLYSWLFYEDMRVRQKAQFELVNRNVNGFELLKKATQSNNQLARIHGVWGLGQLARKDKKIGVALLPLLQDADAEIVAQTAKAIGDAKIEAGAKLIALLKSEHLRTRFYAAEALGKIKYADAVEPLLAMLENNNDTDVYLRHVGVSALTKIAQPEVLLHLVTHPSKALRTAAVLVLRRLRSPQIALFLGDKDEYIVTEAARGINDDLSIDDALPALVSVLNEQRFTAEPLLRRAINAALRVGGEKELDLLIAFALRPDLTDALRAEALATISTWANPSVLDRVDGRFRGAILRDASLVKTKILPHISELLQDKNPETQISIANLLGELGIDTGNEQLVQIYEKTEDVKLKSAILTNLDRLNYPAITTIIKNGMEDKISSVRATALGLLNNNNVSKEILPSITNHVFASGTIKEQQQFLAALCKMEADKTSVVLSDLVQRLATKKVSENITLELREAIDANGSESLKKDMAALKTGTNMLDDYAEALHGGNKQNGMAIFNYNATAQCIRCHTVGNEAGTVGPNLAHIGSTLKREQILEALIMPSARLAPGYGTVILKLDDGQEITGVLAKETENELTLTTTEAEPLIIPTSRIKKRENIASSMPAMGDVLTKREIRDLVEFLTTMK